MALLLHFVVICNILHTCIGILCKDKSGNLACLSFLVAEKLVLSDESGVFSSEAGKRSLPDSPLKH
jgi:hypothetical protein